MGACRPTRAIVAVAVGLSATACGSSHTARPARASARASDALPRVVTVYVASVRASGRLTVSFTSASSTPCGGADRCAVRRATMTWGAPAGGGIELIDLGGNERPRLQASLDLTSTPRMPQSSFATSIQRAGSGSCMDSTEVADEAELPVTDDGDGGLTFSLYGVSHPLVALGPQSPLSLAEALLSSGPQADVPPPTHCGGPLPADFLPLLPSRQVSLATLRDGATRIDLSGTAAFAAHGFRGSVRSTIVLHVARLRGQAQQTRTPRVPLSEADRVITLGYRVMRVSGAVAIKATGNPSTCEAFAACGLSAAMTVQPGFAAGHADLIAYAGNFISWRLLRRAVGLAPGHIPLDAQVYGLATWTSNAGSVSAALTRNGTRVCDDSAPLHISAVEIMVQGQRARAVFGGSDFAFVTPGRDLLRTRCPGPVLGDLDPSQALASVTFPVALLARPTLTLHLVDGATEAGPGFTWRSKPDLTIVLRRTRLAQRLVSSAAFET